MGLFDIFRKKPGVTNSREEDLAEPSSQLQKEASPTESRTEDTGTQGNAAHTLAELANSGKKYYKFSQSRPHAGLILE